MRTSPKALHSTSESTVADMHFPVLYFARIAGISTAESNGITEVASQWFGATSAELIKTDLIVCKDGTRGSSSRSGS